MATTFNIPKATLHPPGRTAANPIGPFNVPAGATSFALDVRMSQAAGANNSFDIGVQRSLDGGATWTRFAGGGVTGGATYPDGDGNDFVCSAQFFGGQPFDAMQVQMVVLVTGANLVFAGGDLVVS